MRGIVFILEAVIAGILLLLFMALIPPLLAKLPATENPGWQMLEQLDYQGSLRNWTIAENSTGLNSLIETSYWNHSIQICNLSACAGSAPVATNVLVSSRFIGGEQNYSPHVVKLYLWK